MLTKATLTHPRPQPPQAENRKNYRHLFPEQYLVMIMIELEKDGKYVDDT